VLLRFYRAAFDAARGTADAAVRVTADVVRATTDVAVHGTAEVVRGTACAVRAASQRPVPEALRIGRMSLQLLREALAEHGAPRREHPKTA
jgi:hypothetical protein